MFTRELPAGWTIERIPPGDPKLERTSLANLRDRRMQAAIEEQRALDRKALSEAGLLSHDVYTNAAMRRQRNARAHATYHKVAPEAPQQWHYWAPELLRALATAARASRSTVQTAKQGISVGRRLQAAARTPSPPSDAWGLELWQACAAASIQAAQVALYATQHSRRTAAS